MRSIGAEGMDSFKPFVKKFVVQMSRDFATPSMVISDESTATKPAKESAPPAKRRRKSAAPSKDDDDDKPAGEPDSGEALADEGAVMKRRWESEAHPYLFINADKSSMTFMGFRIDERTGDLLDPNGGIVSSGVMGKGLYHALA